MSKPCARCGHAESEHPAPMTAAEALAWPTDGPCHRYEPPVPKIVRKLTGR